MPTVLSIDVGLRHLGYAVLHTASGRILLWGVAEVFKQDGSYLSALLALADRLDNAASFSVVIIERQLKHKNFQAGRVEANLEGLFAGRGKRVHIMPADYKYDFHGVEVPNNLRIQFQRWEDAALVRRSRSSQASATSSQLSKSQQTRLNKKMAKAIAAHFLSVSPQTADILTAYSEAGKKDDMADALLQALAYANAVLPEGVLQG